MNVLVKLSPWENSRLYESDFAVYAGDKVIVAGEFSNELGTAEKVDVSLKDKVSGRILRLATKRDKEVFDKYEEQKEEMLKICKEMVKKNQLEMKVVDTHIGLDGKQIIFAFTADGRIDFRDLVKELSRVFKKTIRMQQIGSRDVARKLGGYGICGRQLCCMNFEGSIQSVTTDMARIQCIAHRGSERISGLCGRLMCCLAYETEQYKNMMSGMPELYSIVETAEGKGTIMEINAVNQEIKVKLENGKFIIIKKKDISKNAA